MKNTRTNKTIESFIVIILMVIVLAAMVILMNSGRIAYSRIISNSDSVQNARTALSYINMKVRQNDMENSMEYVENLFNGRDALVIKHGGLEKGMITYIFHDGEALREIYVMEGRNPDPDDGILIVKIDGLDISIEPAQGIVKAVAYYSISGNTKTMERIIGIRTGHE